MTTPDVFQSPKMLVDEALSTIEEFRTSSSQFMTAHPPTRLDYIDRQRNVRVVGLRQPKTPPNRPRVQASRIIKDLRDALDQVCFQASRLLDPDCGTHTYFPFCQDPGDFQTLFAARGRCRSIPEELRPFLLALEPFSTAKDRAGGNDLLRALGRVSGPNKHQITLSVVLNAGGVGIESIEGACAIQFRELRNGDLELLHAPIGGKLSYSLKIHPIMQFGPEAGHLALGPAGAVLSDLARITQAIILGVEAETLRIAKSRKD